MAKIFISYSRRDSKFTDALVSHLEQRGYDVWIDRQSISGGSEWRAEIANSIRLADAFIIVLSPNSVGSDNVSKELAIADDHKKRILPVQLAPCDLPPSMEYQLASLQRISFNQLSFEEGLTRLLEALPPTDGKKVNVQPENTGGSSFSKKLLLFLGGGVLLLGGVAIICLGFSYFSYLSSPTPTNPAAQVTVPVAVVATPILVDPPTNTPAPAPPATQVSTPVEAYVPTPPPLNHEARLALSPMSSSP